MQAITKFYSDGEVDIMQSVKATVAASTSQFTAIDVFEALRKANPDDEYLEFDTVKRAVSTCATPAVNLIKEISEGVYSK